MGTHEEDAGRLSEDDRETRLGKCVQLRYKALPTFAQQPSDRATERRREAGEAAMSSSLSSILSRLSLLLLARLCSSLVAQYAATRRATPVALARTSGSLDPAREALLGLVRDCLRPAACRSTTGKTP